LLCDGVARKNNKEKIRKVFQHCKGKKGFENIYFFSDREYENYQVNEEVKDLKVSPELNNFLTCGHSLENYFLSAELVTSTFRQLTNSIFREYALTKFYQIFDDGLKLIAGMCFSAHKHGIKYDTLTYLVTWESFCISDNKITFDNPTAIENSFKNNEELYETWKLEVSSFVSKLTNSQPDLTWKLPRGHTALRLLQRLFAKCIYNTAISQGSADEGQKDAKRFNDLQENMIATSLSVKWQDFIIQNNFKNYPDHLIRALGNPPLVNIKGH